jgi:3-methyl-2-oxobutanoate hydroxymethyltransferase
VSATASGGRITVQDIRERKGGEPIVCLTAYTAPMAQYLDPHVDLLLVGDSLGMVLYGLDSTIGVSLETMIGHGAAVVRRSKRACVVVDLPFGSYQESREQAFRNSARVLAETGCAAVKLEGGVEIADTIAFLTSRGVPVMAHIGLMPQHVNLTGSYRAQGRDQVSAARIREDGRAISDAGAFSVVVECTAESLARELTKSLPIPTIGIGASPACDGQILVTEDMIGAFSDLKPRFVKRYAEVGHDISAAVQAYASEVKARRFPAPEHCFGAAKATIVKAS